MTVRFYALAGVFVLAASGVSASIQTSPNPEQRSNCDSFYGNRGNVAPLASTCEFVISLSRTLPNFLAEQIQTRLTQTEGEIIEKKVVSATLTYENGHEQYSSVKVDGIPVKEQSFATAGGFMTFGEFASLLNGIFAERSHAEYVNKGLDSLNRMAFDFHIRKQDNQWWALRDAGQEVFPELRGTVYLDSGGFRIRSVNVEAVDIPSGNPLQNVTVTTEYDERAIPDLGTFWLPVASRWNGCLRPIPLSRRLHPKARPPRQTCITNSVIFENYRKFASKSRIIPEAR